MGPLVLAAGGSSAWASQAAAPLRVGLAARTRARDGSPVRLRPAPVRGRRRRCLWGAIDFEGVQVVENRQFGEGCSSSIAAALAGRRPRAQRGSCSCSAISRGSAWPPSRRSSLGAAGRRCGPVATPTAAGTRWCSPRSQFGELAELHGDKGVWKLLDRHADQVVDVHIDGPIPPDVDTWEDYRAVSAPTRRTSRRPEAATRRTSTSA